MNDAGSINLLIIRNHKPELLASKIEPTGPINIDVNNIEYKHTQSIRVFDPRTYYCLGSYNLDLGNKVQIERIVKSIPINAPKHLNLLHYTTRIEIIKKYTFDEWDASLSKFNS